jgi:hypothetical protein
VLSQLSIIGFANVHGKSINKTTKLIVRLVEITEVCTKITHFEEYHKGTTNLYRNPTRFLFPLFFANYMLHGQRPTLMSSCKSARLCLQLLSSQIQIGVPLKSEVFPIQPPIQN